MTDEEIDLALEEARRLLKQSNTTFWVAIAIAVISGALAAISYLRWL